MFFAEFAISLLVALTLSSIFVLLTRKHGKRRGFLWLFLFILVATWAGGLWLRPVGPAIDGLHWLQFLIAGLIFVGLMVLFSPRRPPHGRIETLEKLAEMRQGKALEQATYIALGIFFWVILAVLVFAIIFRYLFLP